MKDANNNKAVDWVDTSNAVLTPHLIHPNFFKRSMTRVHQGATQDFGPISDKVKDQRKSWCERQVEVVLNSVSNAVLGGAV